MPWRPRETTTKTTTRLVSRHLGLCGPGAVAQGLTSLRAAVEIQEQDSRGEGGSYRKGLRLRWPPLTPHHTHAHPHTCLFMLLVNVCTPFDHLLIMIRSLICRFISSGKHQHARFGIFDFIPLWPSFTLFPNYKLYCLSCQVCAFCHM